MTTRPARPTTSPPLPEPPQRELEDMTSFKQLTLSGRVHCLVQYLGSPETTVIDGERYLISESGVPENQLRRPDLLIALNASKSLYEADNGYVISNQGKPPDFILEVASPTTRETDNTTKRSEYAELGIPEYWRFDETEDEQSVKLAGGRLVGWDYQPIEIETLEDGSLQGYSQVLNLWLRWEEGQLGWYDPATGLHIPTFEDERRGRLREREGRLAAEARVRELEAQLAWRDQDA